MNYARIENDVAVDVSTDPYADFHPSMAAEFVEVPNQVKNGWIRDRDGNWSSPYITPSTPETDTPTVSVSPVEFKLLFTSQERIGIRTLKATDPIIEDFWDIVDDPRLTQVNLGLQSTINGVSYAVQQLVVEGIINAEDAQTRISEILSGQVN